MIEFLFDASQKSIGMVLIALVIGLFLAVPLNPHSVECHHQPCPILPMAAMDVNWAVSCCDRNLFDGCCNRIFGWHLIEIGIDTAMPPWDAILRPHEYLDHLDVIFLGKFIFIGLADRLRIFVELYNGFDFLFF
ncbi:hypothetical protein KR96_13160 [Ralstonia solanacearum]|nr:hypothetical protein KR96_13160 [Ralstonia solanacearum]KFX81488.1 hypothetical protein KR99_22865 [Ralstonia solanacearum]